MFNKILAVHKPTSESSILQTGLEVGSYDILNSIMSPPKTAFLFDQLNPNQWTKGTSGWEDNLSKMVTDNVRFSNSHLSININRAAGSDLPFTGGELQSSKLFSDGQFSFWIKNGGESGSVGGAFLITPWHPGEWHQQEIDIEFLGNDPNVVQFNLHSIRHNINIDTNGDGIPDSFTSSNDTNDCFKKVIDLGFNSKEGVHQYTIDFNKTEKYLAFLVDGVEKYRITDPTYLPTDPLQIRLNHWVPSHPWDDKIGSYDSLDHSSINFSKFEYAPTLTKGQMIETLLTAQAIIPVFSFISGLLASFLATPIKKFIINPLFNLFHKKTNEQQSLPPSFEIKPKFMGVSSAIGGGIFGAVKFGTVASILGPLGIIGSALLGGCIGALMGGLSGYSGTAAYQFLAKKVKSSSSKNNFLKTPENNLR